MIKIGKLGDRDSQPHERTVQADDRARRHHNHPHHHHHHGHHHLHHQGAAEEMSKDEVQLHAATLGALLRQKNKQFAEMLARFVLLDLLRQEEPERVDHTEDSEISTSSGISDSGSDADDAFEDLVDDELGDVRATSARTKPNRERSSHRYRQNRPTQGIMKPRNHADSVRSERYIGALISAIERSQNSGTILDFAAAAGGSGAGAGRVTIKIPRSIFETVANAAKLGQNATVQADAGGGSSNAELNKVAAAVKEAAYQSLTRLAADDPQQFKQLVAALQKRSGADSLVPVDVVGDTPGDIRNGIAMALSEKVVGDAPTDGRAAQVAALASNVLARIRALRGLQRHELPRHLRRGTGAHNVDRMAELVLDTESRIFVDEIVGDAEQAQGQGDPDAAMRALLRGMKRIGEPSGRTGAVFYPFENASFYAAVRMSKVAGHAIDHTLKHIAKNDASGRDHDGRTAKRIKRLCKFAGRATAELHETAAATLATNVLIRLFVNGGSESGRAMRRVEVALPASVRAAPAAALVVRHGVPEHVSNAARTIASRVFQACSYLVTAIVTAAVFDPRVERAFDHEDDDDAVSQPYALRSVALSDRIRSTAGYDDVFKHDASVIGSGYDAESDGDLQKWRGFVLSAALDGLDAKPVVLGEAQRPQVAMLKWFVEHAAHTESAQTHDAELAEQHAPPFIVAYVAQCLALCRSINRYAPFDPSIEDTIQHDAHAARSAVGHGRM